MPHNLVPYINIEPTQILVLMKRFLLLLTCVLLIAPAVLSCSRSTPNAKTLKNPLVTSISDIVENPQKYADEVVTVRGEVSNSMGLFSTSAFTLTDHTGFVTVYCPHSMAPLDGETVKIRGQVHLVYRFRGSSFCYIKQIKNN